MTGEDRPAHSPLGASGAERWMNCPGSASLLKSLALPPSDDPDYRREGTAAHEIAARCLKDGSDAWEHIGQTIEGVEINQEIADSVQGYLDEVRPLMSSPNAVVLIEQGIQFKDHEKGYGTVDCAVISDSLLAVNDFKHGAGIAVDAEYNPQIMYYAYGILEKYPEVRRVVMRIIQPRAFHPEGPVRRWECSAEDIVAWVQAELLPAMWATEFDATLDPGPWCRFCPAKLICPMMVSLFGACMKADPKQVIDLSDDAIGRSYQHTQAVKSYLKALEEETFRRLNTGRDIPGVKLVNKRANRVFKQGAVEIFTAHYGERAFTKPDLLSPAEMAKLDAAAKELVKEWAYTPNNGLTVALANDKRVGVKVQSSTEAFGAAAAALDSGDVSSDT